MKFYQFLDEAKSAKKENQEKIVKDCRPYLKLLEKHNIPTPFYRGISKSNAGDIFLKKSVRKNRVPKAINKQVFEEINEMLDEEGYARRDESVIATAWINWTEIFGVPYMMFPIGSFKYSFVDTFDFNSLKNKKGISEELEGFLRGSYKEDGETFEFDDFSDDFIENALDELKKYIFKNKGIKISYQKGYEIWFNCDNYYAVRCSKQDKIEPEKYLSELLEML